jgi:hypothetical protein
MIGERGCGAWTCVGGGCQVVERCEDLDGDGFASGADCACSGEALDCDDGDSNVGDTSSVGCCNGGARACVAGVWGLCSGATGETCDGVDDDCNGAVDDLGDITCGIGACRKTVPACADATLGVCIPNPPLSDTDGCNGIDDDCDGAVDEDCAKCIHVSLDGNDALAASNDGATPFRSVQEAIDFADTHRHVANRVCVAAGPTCGSSATFAGPANANLTMREGISLLGNYESTCWSRCNDSMTRLELGTPRGVVFSADISLQTTLDGFSLAFDASVLASAPDVATVSVNGARGVVLSNLSIGAPPAWPSSPLAFTGVTLTNGALASVHKSRIDTLANGVVSAAVRAVDATVVVDENCSASLSATTGRCAGACGDSGAQIRDRIVLENAPSSRVERSSICGSVVQLGAGDRSILSVSGHAGGVVVRGNFINVRSNGDFIYPVPVVLRFEECGGDAPWLVDNESIQADMVFHSRGELIRAAGDCHPVIEANRSIRNFATYSTVSGSAIVCAGGTKPSRCAISDNPSIIGMYEDIGVGGLGSLMGTPVAGTAIACRDASCARIVRNRLVGIETHVSCRTSGCWRKGTGISLSGGSPVITHNLISSGFMPMFSDSYARFTAASLAGTTNGRVAHNDIASFYNTSLFSSDGSLARPFYTLSFDGSARDFEANRVGPTTWRGGGTLRGNCFRSFTEADANADPLAFENNTIESTRVFDSTWGYTDENTSSLDAAAVNALTDMITSGNTGGPCTRPVGP